MIKVQNFLLKLAVQYSSVFLFLVSLNTSSLGQVDSLIREAEQNALAARKAEQNALRIRYLMISQNMAIRSLSIEDDQLAGLLALQAYHFNNAHDGFMGNTEIYTGLLSSLKRFGELPVKEESEISFSAKKSLSTLGSGLNIPPKYESELRTHLKSILLLWKSKPIFFKYDNAQQQLAVLYSDNSIRVWNLVNMRQAPLLIEEKEKIIDFEFTPANNGIVTKCGAGNSTNHIWSLSLAALAVKICPHLIKNMTVDQWDLFVAQDLDYEATCPNLPPNNRQY